MVELALVVPGGDMPNENWLDELVQTAENGKKPNDIFKLFLVYKFVKKGKNKEATQTDKRWDKINFPSSAAHVKRILEAYDGDIKKAAQAILEIGEWFEKAELTWNLASVYRKLTDWEENRLGRN